MVKTMKASEMIQGQWYRALNTNFREIVYCVGRTVVGNFPVIQDDPTGETVFVAGEHIDYCHIPNCTGFDHKFWEPPSFLTKGWVFRTKSHYWYWSKLKPILNEVNFHQLPDMGSEWFVLNCFNWTPPHANDVPWQKTLTEIP